MDEDVKFVLGRLEGKVDALLASHTNQQDQLKGQEQRIRSLEQLRWMVLGAAGVVGAVGSFALKYLGGAHG